jgi:signal transduction histidine kinase
MRIKYKVALNLSVTLIAIAIGVVSIFNFFILSQFAELEAEVIQSDTTRVVKALNNVTKALIKSALDRARSSATSTFMKDSNEKYFSPLNRGPLPQMQLSYVLYFQRSGKLHYGIESYDNFQKIERIGETSLIVRAIRKMPDIFRYGSFDSNKSGYLFLNDKLHLYVSVPIPESKKTQSSLGTVVLIQKLSDNFFKTLGKQHQLALTALSLENETLDKLDLAALRQAESGNGTAIVPDGQTKISGYALIRDSFGKPVVLVRVDRFRDIYAVGITQRNFLIIFLVLLIVTINLIIMFFIDKKILPRLKFNGIAELNNNAKHVPPFTSSEVEGRRLNADQMTSGESKEVISPMQCPAQGARSQAPSIASKTPELYEHIRNIMKTFEEVDEEIKSDNGRELFKTAYCSVWRLLNVVNEMVDFSKIESGEVKVEKVYYDIRALAGDAGQIVLGSFGNSKAHQIILEIGTDVPTALVGDRAKMEQIFIHLLANAVKFTVQGPIKFTVQMQKFAADPFLVIKVSDSGIGITDENVAILKSFTQLDESKSFQYQGTGLGLPIVKHFTKVMGGSIHVDSNLGQGTTFSLWFPVEKPSLTSDDIPEPSSPILH